MWLIVFAVLLGLWLIQDQPANVTPAHPWRYPCKMHYNKSAGIETFTPAKDFWKGECQQ